MATGSGRLRRSEAHGACRVRPLTRVCVSVAYGRRSSASPAIPSIPSRRVLARADHAGGLRLRFWRPTRGPRSGRQRPAVRAERRGPRGAFSLVGALESTSTVVACFTVRGRGAARIGADDGVGYGYGHGGGAAAVRAKGTVKSRTAIVDTCTPIRPPLGSRPTIHRTCEGHCIIITDYLRSRDPPTGQHRYRQDDTRCGLTVPEKPHRALSCMIVRCRDGGDCHHVFPFFRYSVLTTIVLLV